MANWTVYESSLRTLARVYNENPGMQQMLDLAGMLVTVARGCDMEQPTVHHEAVAHQISRLLEKAKALRNLAHIAPSPIEQPAPTVSASRNDLVLVAGDIAQALGHAFFRIDQEDHEFGQYYPAFSTRTFEPPTKAWWDTSGEPPRIRAWFELQEVNGPKYRITVEEA